MSQREDWLVEWAARPQRYDLLVLLPNLGRGGAQRVASLLVDAWAGQGYRICVATYSDKAEDAHRLDERVTRLKVREFLRIRTGHKEKKKEREERRPPIQEDPLGTATAPVLRLESRARPEAGSQPAAAEAAPLQADHEAKASADDAVVVAIPTASAKRAEIVPAPPASPPTPAPVAAPTVEEPPAASEAGVGLMDILRTVKRVVRRRLRAALFPVREAGRMIRRHARDARRMAREAKRVGREARRMAREARRIGREARRMGREARRSVRAAGRDARRSMLSAGRDLRGGLRSYGHAALGLLDWLNPAFDRLHFKGAIQCARALFGAARNTGRPPRTILQYGDLLTDRAKCRQVLATRLLMEHVQAPVTLAFLGATNIVAALARQGLPTRLVISERNDPARQELMPVWQELRPLMYGAADVVTANSRGAVETMRAWMPASHLAYVPNPLRVPPDPGTRRSRSGPRFISVGRLVPQKRVDLVIEAFARLDGLDGWTLEVLGDGPERSGLDSLVALRGIAARVRFHGHVDPFSHLYASDIFVLASDFEGMPNALLEAMACGVVPIVNDATPGPLEFVEHDVTGLVVPAGDLGALAGAMRELATDELRRARLAAAARERMEELALDHVLETWAGVLRLPEPPAVEGEPPKLAGMAR
ncbi:MAG TPA: glycosyltransferase [Geminicoccaceae bacterium]|nr:glycosyltransferase [Geminicoccus sp.]HMU51314.1 glycosyltransferase [Geminicoccaceae bacterium]